MNRPLITKGNARGIDQSLPAQTLVDVILGTQLTEFAFGISQSLLGTGIRREHFSVGRRIHMRAQRYCGGARMTYDGFERDAGSLMQKAPLISVVEDDQFFRESMRRLMRSQNYIVEVFSSAADFLASPHLTETACLIADVHMPAMTGIELYKRLIDAGHAIPTILVTAYPNDVDRARVLKDGVVCYLRKPVDDEHLIGCLRSVLDTGKLPEEN
jgi:CheY-like chemotaxis protein